MEMKILILNEYEKQWKGLGEFVNNKHKEVPCYFEYLQREVYFQDYLDVFTGVEQETYKRQKVGDKWTVLIPALEMEDTKEKLTRIGDNGEVRLVVDHDFPYRKLLGVKRKVKYLLIGEAAPAGGKYIYKDAMGSYMTAPLRASGINTDNLKSIERLSEFAKKGFLHLDLFPFAFDFKKYSSLREKLSADEKLIARFFKSLEDIVETFIRNAIIEADWDFCFVGPKLTSKALINKVNSTNDKSFVGRSISSIHDINAGVKFKGSEDYFCRPEKTGSKLKHLPRNAKLTVIMGGSGPHHELIQRALKISEPKLVE